MRAKRVGSVQVGATSSYFGIPVLAERLPAFKKAFDTVEHSSVWAALKE